MQLEEIVNDEEALKLFLSGVKEFDSSFSEMMAGGDDFTIRLEVRGNKGIIHHVRVYRDNIRRPAGSQKKIDAKESACKGN